MKLGPFRRKNARKGCGRKWRTYLNRLFPKKYRIYLGEVGSEQHLRFHFLGRPVEDCFPERNEELVGMLDASLDD